MDSSGTFYRETSSKVKDPRSRSKTAIPQQRTRIVKKHLQQKFLLCGFAIHAFLASPAYLYGIVVDSDRELIVRIWPPIIYQAVGQICQSVLLHTAEKSRGKVQEQTENRKIFLCATIIICSAITVCGYLFSSAWITVTTTTQIIAVVIYGLFGGIGSSLIYSKTHIILESVRPPEDKYVRKTIQVCGEAFCQIFLSFVFTSLRTLYGISQTLVLMSALLINIIPLSLLVTRKPEDSIEIEACKLKGGDIQLSITTDDKLRTSNFSNNDNLDGIELQQKTWRNPKGSSMEAPWSYMAVAPDESYTAYININGVEIMEIIPEEDETTSSANRSSCATINNSRLSVEQTPSIVYVPPDATNLERIQRFSKDFTNHMLDNVATNVVNPLQRAMVISTLYPATLLQSSDIFSYVMCLTVLPYLSVQYHALKFAEIPFLYSLLAFPWMCFALMTPRFGSALIKEKVKWHTFGCVSKALSLIFISFSTSKLLLSLASILLGFGQGVSLFLQDAVVESVIPKAHWNSIRYPMYSTNGGLILVWGVLAHFTVASFGFQASVGLAAFLYSFSILVWYLGYILKFLL